MKTLVLTAPGHDARSFALEGRDDVAIKPLSRAVRPAQAIRDGFIRGAETVVLTDVALDDAELGRGLFELRENDAVAWLDPQPLGPSTTVLRLRENLVPPHVGAVAVRRHAWDAMGNHVRSRRVRAAVVELAVRVHRVGLDVRYLDATASPRWSWREGRDVLQGWLTGYAPDPSR